MNTPAHILLALGVFSRHNRPAVTCAAFLGGVAPDLSLYAMAGTSLYVLDIPARTVFRELYYSPAWQAVFRIDNSFILWGILLAFALWRRSAVLTAFSGAALLHLACDFPLHHNDGRPQFWPLTSWVFESPVSYWDRRFGAGVIAPIEAALALLAGALAVLRCRSIWVGLTVLILLAMEFYAVFH